MAGLKFNPEAIRNLREAHNLTPPAFARRIGSNRNAPIKWERGEVKPSVSTIEAISTEFNIADANVFFSR